MSSSDPDSKIDFLDSPEVVRRKIKKAFCEEGNKEENGILAFVKAVLIPVSRLRLERIKGQTFADSEEGEGATGDQKPFATDDAPEGTVFTIERDAKFGGSTHYSSYDALEADFVSKALHPKDLKTSVANGIIKLLDPIQKSFNSNEDWQNVERLAYPDPNAKPKTKKKVCCSRLHVSTITYRCYQGKNIPSTSPWEREKCTSLCHRCSKSYDV